MVMSGVPPPMVEALRRVRRRLRGTRLWTCCAGRAGTRIRSEALQRMLSIGRPSRIARSVSHQLTFILDSSELLGPRRFLQEAKAGSFAYNCRRRRLEPSLTTAGGEGWSLRLQCTEDEHDDEDEDDSQISEFGLSPDLAGALLATPSADRPKRLCERQRLEPSLTSTARRQRLEPSLTQLQEAKAGAFAYNSLLTSR